MSVLVRALSAAVLLATVVPIGVADARSVTAHHPRTPVAAPAVSVMVESAEGGSFASVQHRGATFVAGEIGERYVVRLVNDSADRLEVVVTVDGRDVLSGKVGDFKRDRGYVVEPFGEVVVDGFRRSLDHVAAFRFSSLRDAYAVRRGTSSRSRSIGVIGVAVFRERVRPHSTWRGSPLRSADEALPTTKSSPTSKAPQRSGSAKDRSHEKLGTEFGETVDSAVVEVPFVRSRATTPDELHRVQYDSAERLIARGVPIDLGFEPWQSADHEPWNGGGWPSAHQERFAPPPPPPARRHR